MNNIIDTVRFLELKSMFEKQGFIPLKVGIMLLEDRLDYQLQINELWKQLNYAIQTGGECLEIHKQVH